MSCPLCGGTIPVTDDLVINVESCNIARKGIAVKFTPSEFLLFEELHNKRPRTLTKAYLLDTLMADRPNDDPPEENILKVHLNRINKKIAPLGLIIRTTWGVGHYMEVTS